MSFFVIPDTSLLLTGEYSPVLVTISIFISVASSYMAFRVAGQAAESEDNNRRLILLGLGSLALGGGIWAMHFIGMLAFELCTPVTWAPWTTFMSFIPGVLAAFVALQSLTHRKVKFSQVFIGGVLVGSGIGAMHYTGMAAMEMAPLLRYNLLVFALSIVVAVLLAMLSLWIKFGLKRFAISRGFKGTRVIASVVMGCAITAMHYTGMAAARFVAPPGLETSAQDQYLSYILAGYVSFFTLLIIGIVMGITMLFRYMDISQKAENSRRTQLALMDTAIDGILTVNDQGTVLNMNQAVTTILGWTEEDLTGHSIHRMIPEEMRGRYNEQFFRQEVVPVDEQIIGVSRDVEALNKTGLRVPVRVGVGHTRLGEQNLFVVIVGDNRERIEMEKTIRDNEAKFRSFFHNIPGIAYRSMNTPGWPFEFVSAAVEEFSGYPVSAFIRSDSPVTLEQLVHEDDRESFLTARRSGAEFYVEYRLVHKDGTIKWLREYGNVVHSTDKTVSWVDGFIMDITSRKEMEEELRHAKNDAEQAAAARASFLANMSHEIRTPMNAIIGFSDILLDEKLTDGQHKHLTTINRSARSLLHLLNDILDSAKLDKGKLDLEYRDFSITEEIDTVVSTYWLEAKRKGLMLGVSVSPSLSDYYYGAPERIRQVLNNLISNAVKFTAHGEVDVEVYPDADGMIAFSVSDSGIGMTSEQVSRVFDAFAQADASMSRKYGGTGLGTTISKQLVELMGGTISVSSEPERGTNFTFTLPLTAVEKQASEIRAATVDLPPLHILVVDDISQNIDLISLLLNRAGHTVDFAENGARALEKMNKGSFDIVLMDLQMPVMDGLTAAARRREYEQVHHLKQLPIVALTASVLVQDKQDAIKAGMEGFANKPIDFPVLVNEIARVLGLETKESVRETETAREACAIDYRRGVQLWGDKDTLNKEISQFLRNSHETLTKLVNFFADDDYEQVVKYLHGMKGVSGNLGLTKLMNLCGEFERSARNDHLSAEDIPTLKTALREVENELNRQKEEPAAEESREEIDIAALRNTLNALLVSAAQNQFDESTYQYCEGQYFGSYNVPVQGILQDMDDFEFERAVERIKQLLASTEQTGE
ncbi:PAS domain S-box protein [Alteromonas sp. NFXS44]